MTPGAAERGPVTPNKRGARSREAVLDAAERVMAEYGYTGATMSLIVQAAEIPASSIYHYFGSKDGVLLAVMQRGAEHFFARIPETGQRVGTPEDHLRGAIEVLKAALEASPDFLRLLIVMAAQPPRGEVEETLAVVRGVRQEAERRLRSEYALAFDTRPDTAVARRLATFTLAVIDGAFVATQADPELRLGEVLDQLPSALVALRETTR
ncbi:MAG: TetR/AcrR family transcriptional regulator [Actinobacteria bacterium]|nr:TetR/AcrR family transcriptional regulator [Actinomycetota bacterium]